MYPKIYFRVISFVESSVFCNLNNSPFNSVGEGIPQGSVLDPTFFLIYKL